MKLEVYVWGTGCVAGDLEGQGLSPERVTAFLDSELRGERFLGRPVIRPEELAGRPFDLLLVASRQAEAIAARAEALGIPAEKMIFLRSNWTAADRNRDYRLADAVLGEALTEELKRPRHTVCDPLWAKDSALPPRELENDYVRVRTLEALCARLAEVPGAAAELGVYRGAFARLINLLLPDRTLYLFDTFAGFDEAEAAGEAAGFVEAHRNADIAAVKRLLPHPERAVWKPGLFPASLDGLEERFALVSLDVDLERSTLEGLRYFYPRLNPGGCLLLHDWRSPRLPGVRRALERYEAELGRRLPAVPLCDINGSLAICK